MHIVYIYSHQNSDPKFNLTGMLSRREISLSGTAERGTNESRFRVYMTL